MILCASYLPTFQTRISTPSRKYLFYAHRNSVDLDTAFYKYLVRSSSYVLFASHKKKTGNKIPSPPPMVKNNVPAITG